MAETDPSETIRGDKRWIAAIMVDVVGSTELTERLGSERAFTLFREVLRQCLGAIEAEGGHFVDSAGDSIFAIFGAPVAIENAALAACRAALAVQARLAAQAGRFEAEYGSPLQARIGIAGGSVLVARLGLSDQGRLNALGTAVNLAARLQSIAAPGEIVCAEAIDAEIRGFARTEPLGRHAIKGLREPQALFRLVALEQGASNLQGRMARGGGGYVGRESLCAQLAAWLTRPRPDPEVLVVAGPPGIGKSLLVHHVLTGLSDGVVPVMAHCVPADADAPLQPALRLIRAAAEAEGVGAGDARAAWLAALLGPGEAVLASLRDLLGDGQALPAAGIQAGSGTGGGTDAVDLRRQIRGTLAALAARPGLRLVVEDAHWLDPLSRETLAEVFAAPAGSGRRLLVTSRQPMPLPLAAGRAATLSVPPLNRDETLALCARLLPRLPPADRDRAAEIILGQSEGNPLFAEELSRHVASVGDLDALRAGNAGEIGLIQGLVFSRFDALGQAEKAALKQAALIDRTISPARLGLPMPDGPEAEGILQLAAEHGLVERDATGSWRFAHVLIQDAIAGSIPASEAAGLHRSAAAILIAEGADPAGARPARIARHLELAGLPAQAAPHHLAAAEPAWRVYALDVCLHHLTAAADQLDAAENRDDDALAAAVLTRLCRALDVSGNWSELARVADRHLARLTALPDPGAAVLVLTLRAKAANQAADFATARALIDEAGQRAGATGDAAILAIARVARMDIVNDMLDAPPAEILALYDQTRSYAESGADPHITQMRLYEIGAFHRQMGDIAQAYAAADSMIALGRARSDSRALAFGGWLRASISAMIEDYDAALAEADESLRHSLPDTMDHATATIFRIGALMMKGDRGVTSEFLEAHAQRRLARGDKTVAIIAAFYAAVVHFMRGRIRAGTAGLAATDALVRSGAERGLVQHYLLKKAELYLTIAGQLPNPVPPDLPGLRDLPAAIRLRLSARRLAAATLAELKGLITVAEGFHSARVALLEGLIARASGQKDRACDLLDQALAEFDRQGLAHFRHLALARHPRPGQARAPVAPG